MATPIRHYWDSDVFLSYLLGETTDKRDERCRAGIASATRRDSVIVTSALTLTEVIHLKGLSPLKVEDEEKIAKFFLHEWIIVRAVDRVIADGARKLIWEHSLRPKDSIHVATALSIEADVLYTFDKELLKLTNKIGSPALTIELPGLPPDPMKKGIFEE